MNDAWVKESKGPGGRVEWLQFQLHAALPRASRGQYIFLWLNSLLLKWRQLCLLSTGVWDLIRWCLCVSLWTLKLHTRGSIHVPFHSSWPGNFLYAFQIIRVQIINVQSAVLPVLSQVGLSSQARAVEVDVCALCAHSVTVSCEGQWTFVGNGAFKACTASWADVTCQILWFDAVFWGLRTMDTWENWLLTARVLEHLSTDKEPKFLLAKWSPTTCMIQKVGWLLAGPPARVESSSGQDIWRLDVTWDLDFTDFRFLYSPNHFQAALSLTWELWPLFMELMGKLRLWGFSVLSGKKSGWFFQPRICMIAKRNLIWD